MGDVDQVMPKIRKKFDRILMPLPKGAENFLDLALTKIKPNGVIHLYSFFQKEQLNKRYVRNYLSKYLKNFEILNITKCGQFSPNVFRVCIDFKVFD